MYVIPAVVPNLRLIGISRQSACAPITGRYRTRANECEFLFQLMHQKPPRRNPTALEPEKYKKEEESMQTKTIAGLFAVLLLVTAVALGQGYQPLPFPQAANPALANGSGDESSPSSATSDTPSSMAANQATDSDWSSPAESGSPFPSAGNPSLGSSTSGQSSPSIEGSLSNGSPFPSAANPSRNY